jgi:hypothetical protein
VDEGSGDLTAALEEVRRELARLRQRVDRLEAAFGVVPDGLPAKAAGVVLAETSPHALRLADAPAGVLPLLGRSLVVLGGAYLLRATTDARVVPGLWGTIAGLLYAAAWLLLADRAGAAGRRLSAAFHGATALVIVHPLLFEATARFGLLTPGASAALLLAFFGLSALVAWRRTLPAVATTSVLLGATTALGLLLRTRELVWFCFLLLLMAVIVEVARDRWLGLRWVVALALDLAMLAVLMLDRREHGPVVLLGLSLAFVYLVGASVRACAQKRPVGAFEIVQTTLALVLGYGGAASALARHGGSLAPLAVLGLALGGVAYAVAFAFLERRLASGRNFYAFTTFGCAMTLVGMKTAFDGIDLVLALCLVAGVAVGLGAAFGRMTLEVHSVLFMMAGCVAADLLAYAADGWLGAPGRPWRALGPGGGAVLLTGALVYAVMTRARGHAAADALHRLPAACVAIALVWTLGGAGLVAVARLVDAPGQGADVPGLAALRTAMIALAAVGLASMSRAERLRELSWLVYPLLGLGALKLVVEDLPRGRPVTLFLAFALFGGALIAVPRLARGRRTAEPDGPSTPRI